MPPALNGYRIRKGKYTLPYHNILQVTSPDIFTIQYNIPTTASSAYLPTSNLPPQATTSSQQNNTMSISPPFDHGEASKPSEPNTTTVPPAQPGPSYMYTPSMEARDRRDRGCCGSIGRCLDEVMDYLCMVELLFCCCNGDCDCDCDC